MNIDVHIITMGVNEDMNLCLHSLATEGVNIHVVEGIQGHIGAGRRLGFEQGTAEWVGFVDPDDVIIPGAYRKLYEHRDAGFVWSNELVKVEGGQDYINRQPHHMMIIHRDLLNLEAIGAKKFAPMLTILPLMQQGIHCDEIGYIWNKRRISNNQIARTSHKYHKG